MNFFPEIRPVWQECFRVLASGGSLMTGFTNPVCYIFDFEKANKGEFIARYTLPYSDETSMTPEDRERFFHASEPQEFSHTLDDIMGGLTDLGFAIDRFMEDKWDSNEPIDHYFSSFIMLRATKS